MARARGANLTAAGAFESTYGINPASGAVKLPVRSVNIGGVQGLAEDDTLGFGRNPRDPVLDAKDVEGDITIPHDDRYLGYWLKHFLGNPTTVAALAASGSFAFAAQPVANDTLVVNGITWTWKTTGATGTQVNIGANLAASMTALAVALNASSDPALTPATYTGSATALSIVYDTLGPTGNAFTLGAGNSANVTPSGATLSGGANTHTFKSGATSLPSMAFEVGMPEVSSYALMTGMLLNTIKQTNARKGLADLVLSLLAQDEAEGAASTIGTVTDLGSYQRFANKSGAVRLGGSLIGNLDAGSFEVSNNYDKIESIRGDGLIDGADPAMFTAKGSVTVRFADRTLLNKAKSGLPVDLEYSYNSGVGRSVAWKFARVFLPVPKREVSGPAGIKAQFDWQASYDATATSVLTVVLTNGVASY